MREIKLIRETVKLVSKELGIPVVDVILFGSRARGNARPDSDWDILIVTAKKLDWKERLKLTGEIRKRLAKAGMALDILVISREDLSRLKDAKEYIYYYALREGIKV
jgi:predicted nucleotidyltransferase